jgi:hypothetical protein
VHPMMKMRPGWVVLVLCVLEGCQDTPVKRVALGGNYVYKSEDPEGTPTDHEWDRLTLDSDGKYDLVQGGPTRTASGSSTAETSRKSNWITQAIRSA